MDDEANKEEDLEVKAEKFSEELAQKIKEGEISLDEMPARVAEFLLEIQDFNKQSA
jgi:hypothetical protein